MNSKKYIWNFIIGAVLMNLMILASQTKAVENGKIVFASNDGISTMNSDGSGRTQLTNSGSADFPKFSPDGRKIAFYHYSGAIYLMNADGSNQTFLTSTGGIGFGRFITLSWSPDGQRIVFTCDSGICIVNADGSNRVIVSNNDEDHAPSWSPDGSKIAFTRKTYYDNMDVYVMDVNGNNQTRLTVNEIPDYEPVWSPDGSKIAFTQLDFCFVDPKGELLCFDSNIYTMNADGSNQTFLTGGGFDGGIPASSPGWSPDKTKIVYSGYIVVGQEYVADIFVMNTNASNQSNLTNSPNIAEFSPNWGAITTTLPSRAAFDFDGDGKADISVFRPSDRVWHIADSSNNSFRAEQFGLATDKITPADYDGDGRTDIAVFRDGFWYLQRSTLGFTAVQFGQAGDIPVPADYDGDGRTDFAVFRSGFWYILQNSNNQLRAVQFGAAADKLVPADYDGDGKTDIAVYRDGVWYWQRSSDGGFRAAQFGAAADKPVVGDYDGDGKTDLAVFRPSTGFWYVLRSGDGSFFAAQFGSAIDILIPADFDGDAKTDIAVYRNGVWYVLQSSNGNIISQQFGLNSDTPTPSAFIPQ